MKISTRGEYGLRALLELGMASDKGLSLRDLAQRQHISLDYLEHIVPALKAAGLVRARRGAQGGYTLAKLPAEITVYECLLALEGPFAPMLCVSSQPHEELTSCMASGSCAVQEVWVEMKVAVETVLKNFTLAELIERQQRRHGVPLRTYSEKEIARLVVLH